MAERFRLQRQAEAAEIAFDDGGMNLLSAAALAELRGAIGDVECALRAGEGPRVLTFRSGRDSLFAAGADMAEMLRFSPAQAEEFARQGQDLFSAIERLPVITVAMIDGDCFGGALDLVLSFDLRFATPRSRFAHPGARLGIVTGFGGTSRWRKLLSRPAANALLLANRVLTAEEAADLGLVDRVAENHEQDLRSLQTADVETTRMLKELTRHADRLTRSQLLLLAQRLGTLYLGGSSKL